MAEQMMALETEGRSGPSPVPPALTEIAVGTPCGRCTRQIQSQYFVANGHVVCEQCRASLEGSTARAVGYGLGAGALTVAVYYLVYFVWHMNFVLIAVLAGVTVGLAVRRGAQGNRARRYRFIALGLTYLIVVSTYLPALLELPNVESHSQAALRALYLPMLMLISMKNPVTLILLGFGMHEAWKLSAPHVIAVDGPFAAKPAHS